MDSKIKIKSGELEIEFEGSEAFIKDGLLQMITETLEVFGTPQKGAGSNSNASNSSTNQEEASGSQTSQVDMSTATIASKLGGDSGVDLLLAAAANLTFVQKKSAFSRAELLDEAKNATAYYTQSVSKNLSTYLTRLVKTGKLVQRANDSYAIQNATQSQLRSQLAN